MRKIYACLPLLLLPALLTACSTGTTTDLNPSSTPTLKTTPSPTPTATTGQVLASVTAATGAGEATTFKATPTRYGVQVLCEGDAKAKLRVSVRVEGRQLDANHSIPAETHSVEFNCLSNTPYILTGAPAKGTPADSILLGLDVLSGTVSHASATAIAR